MVNAVLDSITVALYDVFGSNYHYYVEDVEQDLQLPCFTVDVLNPLNRSRNSYQYDRTVPCTVHCFTANKTTTKHELYATGEDVMAAIEYITVDGRLLRAEDMSYQLVKNDGSNVLQIFATYRFWTESEREDYEYMEYLLQQYHSSKS